MAWEPSTDFEGVRPTGFPTNIDFSGGYECPGWQPFPTNGGAGSSLRAWARLPWEPSNHAPMASPRIRDQGGWGFPAYGDACEDRFKRFAKRTISGTAERLVSGGGCNGQVDRTRTADGFEQVWEYSFETVPDDPETEETDESSYTVDFGIEEEGTLMETVNTWTPTGPSTCSWSAGTPAAVAPVEDVTSVSTTTATWSYPNIAGFIPSGALTYTLAEEVTTSTMAALLDEWMDEDDDFMDATGGSAVIYQTQSPEADRGVVARGRVRFSLFSDIPAGKKAVVDMVFRRSWPVDREHGYLADSLWNTGTGKLALSEAVTHSSDIFGEWPRGEIATSHIDEVPWVLEGVPGSSVGADGQYDGDCGLAIRFASLDSSRRFRISCRMTWSNEATMESPPYNGEADFTMEMADGEGEPNRTPSVYWTDHAPDDVRSVGVRALTEDTGWLEEWIDGSWQPVLDDDLYAALPLILQEAKIRGGGPRGFQAFEPSPPDPDDIPTYYSKAAIDIDWSISGTNPDACGDDPSGSRVFRGSVEVDSAGRYVEEDIDDNDAEFGTLSYDPDGIIHPDARHPWYGDNGSYLVGWLPLFNSSDTPDELDLPPPAKGSSWDPYDAAVEVRRDLPEGFGQETSRVEIELSPSSDNESISDWVTPPVWPGAGEFVTWENLRYV